MPSTLPYTVIKSIEDVIKDPATVDNLVKAIEKGLAAINAQAKEQKTIVKAEIKEELARELPTKGETVAIEERLRADIRTTEQRLWGEIKATEQRLLGEIKTTEQRLLGAIHNWRAETIRWMFIFWASQLAAIVGIVFGALKLIPN